jgi:2-succinyl-6-hydroxy-2,4-cyclohexadiene-1-carboxylate synthase
VLLHHTVEGRGPRRIVLVHGFTQTGTTWDDVARQLVAGGEVVRVDLPGHGGSADVRLSFEETAAALGATGGRALYVGYSMGGRLCLRLALDRPDLVTALVLLGASPGVADPAERAERRRSEKRLAADILDCGDADFLYGSLARPAFETARPSAVDLEVRRTNPPDGLAAALDAMGTGGQPPLWDRLGELRMPTLLVAGERDGKFVDIARRMDAVTGPNVRTAFVPESGHAVHLDQPAACVELIRQVAASATTS